MKNLSFYGITAGITTFLLPFIFSNNLFYQSVNSKLFFLYGVIIFFFIVFGFKLISEKKLYLPNIRKSHLLLSLIFLISIYLLSTLLGVNTHKSLFSDISRGTGFIFIASIALLSYILSISLHKDDWKFLFKSIVASSVLISFFNILSTFFFKDLGNFFSSSGKLLGNSTFAGSFIYFGIALTILLMFKTQLKGKRFWIYITLLFIQILNSNIFNYNILAGKQSFQSIISNPFLILGEAQSSSATVFLILLSSVVFYFLIKYTKEISYKKIINWFSLTILAIVVASISMLFVEGSKIQESYINNSTGARLIVWTNSLESFKEKPLVGWGPENFDLAIQKNIDQKLFFKENLNEVWFDRAHNLFIDTLIDTGILGLFAWLLLYFILLRVFYFSYKNQNISYIDFILLCYIVLGNILQLQTAFHNITTYYLLFLLIGYGIYLEGISRKYIVKEQKITKRFLAIFLIISSIIIFYTFFIKELSRQRALFNVFKGIDTDVKEKYINNFAGDGLNFEPLRISSSGMVKGLLIQMGNNSITKEGLINAKKELSFYSKAYENFIYNNPNHYRAKINLSYIYFMQIILGDNKINEAQAVIKDSYRLSPENPITFQMEALSYLYKGKINDAEKKSKEGLEMNPEINFSKNVYDHIKRQEKTFPEVSFLRLENL